MAAPLLTMIGTQIAARAPGLAAALGFEAAGLGLDAMSKAETREEVAKREAAGNAEEGATAGLERVDNANTAIKVVAGAAGVATVFASLPLALGAAGGYLVFSFSGAEDKVSEWVAGIGDSDGNVEKAMKAKENIREERKKQQENGGVPVAATVPDDFVTDKAVDKEAFAENAERIKRFVNANKDADGELKTTAYKAYDQMVKAMDAQAEHLAKSDAGFAEAARAFNEVLSQVDEDGTQIAALNNAALALGGTSAERAV